MSTQLVNIFHKECKFIQDDGDYFTDCISLYLLLCLRLGAEFVVCFLWGKLTWAFFFRDLIRTSALFPRGLISLVNEVVFFSLPSDVLLCSSTFTINFKRKLSSQTAILSLKEYTLLIMVLVAVWRGLANHFSYVFFMNVCSFLFIRLLEWGVFFIRQISDWDKLTGPQIHYKNCEGSGWIKVQPAAL